MSSEHRRTIHDDSHRMRPTCNTGRAKANEAQENTAISLRRSGNECGISTQPLAFLALDTGNPHVYASLTPKTTSCEHTPPDENTRTAMVAEENPAHISKGKSTVEEPRRGSIPAPDVDADADADADAVEAT